LRGDGGSGLGIGKGGSVTKGEDVCEFGRLCCCGIDGNPSGSISYVVSKRRCQYSPIEGRRGEQDGPIGEFLMKSGAV